MTAEMEGRNADSPGRDLTCVTGLCREQALLAGAVRGLGVACPLGQEVEEVVRLKAEVVVEDFLRVLAVGDALSGFVD